jgi:hypothetical protein
MPVGLIMSPRPGRGRRRRDECGNPHRKIVGYMTGEYRTRAVAKLVVDLREAPRNGLLGDCSSLVTRALRETILSLLLTEEPTLRRRSLVASEILASFDIYSLKDLADTDHDEAIYHVDDPKIEKMLMAIKKHGRILYAVTNVEVPMTRKRRADAISGGCK